MDQKIQVGDRFRVPTMQSHHSKKVFPPFAATVVRIEVNIPYPTMVILRDDQGEEYNVLAHTVLTLERLP